MLRAPMERPTPRRIGKHKLDSMHCETQKDVKSGEQIQKELGVGRIPSKYITRSWEISKNR